MNTRLKQRIVGGLVLVAILAIFLPWLFHHSQPITQLRTPQEIPAAPPAPQVSLEMPKTITAQAVSHSTGAAQMNAVTAATTVAAPAAPQSDNDNWHRVAANAVHTSLPAQFDAKILAQNSTAHLASEEKQPATAAVTEAEVKGSEQTITSKVGAVPDAWTIRVATFANEKNANALIKHLRTMGYDAYMRETKLANGNLRVRVFVGPDIRKTEIEKIHQQLQQQFQIKGVVVKYTV